MKSVVVTNLRLPYDEWVAIKTVAAEAGMSVNEFVRVMMKGLSNAKSLTSGWLKPKKGLSLWDLPKLATGESKPLGISSEDELIYE